MHFRIKVGRLIGTVLVSSFLCACAVGPKYRRPVVQTPNHFGSCQRIRKSRPSPPLMPICLGGRFSKIRNYRN